MTGSYVDLDTINRATFGGTPNSAWADAVNDVGNLWRDRPTCRLYSSSQSIPDSAWDAVGFDAEIWDVGGMHSTSSNNTRITIPTGWSGIYRVGGCVSFVTSTAGHNRAVRITINGNTSPMVEDMRDPDANASKVANRIAVETLYILDAGWYVELECYQDTGGALNIEQRSAFSPIFYALWEGPVPS